MMKLFGGAGAKRQRGQSMVEFAMVLPVLAIMLSAILEFGLAVDADLGLEAASREGARVAASLGNDGSQGVCPNTMADDATTGVDATIVQTVATSLSGAGVDLSTVKVWIYGAAANGSANTAINKYAWSGASFTSTNGHPYAACGRHDGTFAGGNYDTIAVQIQMTYTSNTGLLAIFSSGLPMTATCVMPIGPPWKLQ
jgi:Flp pilus assembly protein TadG